MYFNVRTATHAQNVVLIIQEHNLELQTSCARVFIAYVCSTGR